MALKQAKPTKRFGVKIKPMNKTTQTGFTLAELLVGMAIVGILSAIAIPNYTNYTEGSEFSDGKEDVYRVMAQQERYFINNLKYTTTLGGGGIGYTVDGEGNLTSPAGHFLVTAGVCTIAGTVSGDVNTCVRITANGQNRQRGTTIWLQSNGEKSSNIL